MANNLSTLMFVEALLRRFFLLKEHFVRCIRLRRETATNFDREGIFLSLGGNRAEHGVVVQVEYRFFVRVSPRVRAGVRC